MIGWEPRDEVGNAWHLTADSKALMSLCGVRVAGLDRYVRRDPHKINHFGGEPCTDCWMQWRLHHAASLAAQDQHEAAVGAA